MFTEPIHAPIDQLRFDLFEQKQIAVFIKREDLIHPFIVGNKWRKLKYILRDANEKSKTHIVTFGGAFSNHLLAVACAAAIYKFTTTGFVRGEEVSNPILNLCKQFGMQLIFTERQAYKNKVVLFEQYFKDNNAAYFIDEGGAGELGVKGCAEIMDDVAETFDHVFCSVGTATTFEGIVQSIDEKKMPTKVEGICVLKGAEYLNEKINQRNFKYANRQLHHRFHEGGYAKSNIGLQAFINQFESHTDILLDHVYEGKMMRAIFALAEENYFKPGSKILAIHCGGKSGLVNNPDSV